MKSIYITLFALFLGLNNLKAQFTASNFTLASNIDPVGGAGIKYSACWGWTQPGTNKEYAIACSKNGTYWVDVTNPSTPSVCAYIAGTSSNGSWREVKTYQNYCYVVCDDPSSTGFQIFDMSTLPSTVTLISQNANLFRRGHACWVDGNKLYVSGITYTTGSSSMDVYSLATPSAPVLLRRLNQDAPSIGYVHDEFVRNDTVFASCGYQGLFVFKYNSLTNNFVQLGSLIGYPGAGYNHATSWTPDGQTLVMLDEVPASLPIRIVNSNNLANMNVVATTNQFPQTTPHNPWVVSNKYCFISSYQDGTQLYDISSPSSPSLVAYFDTYFQGGGNNNNWAGSAYNGQWGLYPYFPSKNIFALDRTNGIFMMSTHLWANPEVNIQGNFNNVADGSISTNITNNTDFGTVNSGNNQVNTFSIQNSGYGTLTVTSISISGLNASEFTLIGGPSFPFTLATSGTQTFNIQFAPIAGGIRSAVVTVNNNDLDEGAYDFAVSGIGNFFSVGINQYKNNDLNIALFPNPAKSDVEFTLPLSLSTKDILVKIYDCQGKLVAEKNNQDITKTSNLTFKLNLNELTNGLYSFNLISNGQSIAFKKLIISK